MNIHDLFKELIGKDVYVDAGKISASGTVESVDTDFVTLAIGPDKRKRWFVLSQIVSVAQWVDGPNSTRPGDAF